MPFNTGTALFDSQGNNRTATHLSTNIVIVVDGNPVGAVQQLEITEQRPQISMIDEVGTDGHIDSAPSQSTNYNISCQRVRFAGVRAAEAFGRGFIHLKSQRIPFDIEIHDRFVDNDIANSIVTTIQNCWIDRISYVYNARDWVITDNMTLQAEDIFSVFSNNNNVVSSSAPVYINQFERLVDRGEDRGALSYPGLFNAFIDD